MEEIWKTIDNFENYEVSNLGNIRNKETKELKNMPINYYGYRMVCLNSHKMLVHRVVAMMFIPNPNNYPQINHKDENKENNCVDNLEWCSPKYNSNYGNQSKKISNALKGKTREEIHLTYIQKLKEREERRIKRKNSHLYYGFNSKEEYIKINGKTFSWNGKPPRAGSKWTEKERIKRNNTLNKMIYIYKPRKNQPILSKPIKKEELEKYLSEGWLLCKKKGE